MSGGFGVQVRIAVSATQTAIVKMTEAELPEFEKILAENTAHNAAGGWATYVSTGKRKLNEFKATLEWDKSAATHAAVQAAFDSDSPVNMSVVAPDGSETISFSAHVKNIGRATDQEDYYKAEVTIQPTGAPTIT
jgi:predicted secreted protein